MFTIMIVEDDRKMVQLLKNSWTSTVTGPLK